MQQDIVLTLAVKHMIEIIALRLSYYNIAYLNMSD